MSFFLTRRHESAAIHSRDQGFVKFMWARQLASDGCDIKRKDGLTQDVSLLQKMLINPTCSETNFRAALN